MDIFKLDLSKMVLKKNDYKSASYKDTISKIDRIISDLLKGTNLEFKKLAKSSRIKDIWITQSGIFSDKKPLLVTSGKGRTKKGSLASAYGELMERLQGGFISFNKSNHIEQEYIKEEDLTPEMRALNKGFSEEILKRFPFLPERANHFNKYVSFYDIKNQEEVKLHVRYLCSSTGFASGNTYEEALIQAICEVFERSCGLWVLSNKLKCPTIPLNLMNVKSNKYVTQFCDQDISILIKDFSLSKGFPVIGALFHHNKEDIYELVVGSATDRDLAFERCITEFLQMGLGDIECRLNRHNSYVEEHVNFYKCFPFLESYIPFQTFCALRFKFFGFFPSAGLKFLSSNGGNYQKWNYSHQNLSIELDNILNLLDKQHYHVYFNDYNRFYFPTIKIIIPELHYGLNEFNYFIPQEIVDFKRRLIFQPNDITPSELDLLLTPQFLLYLFYNPTVPLFFNEMVEVSSSESMWEFLIAFSKKAHRNDIAQKYAAFYSLKSRKENDKERDVDLEIIRQQCPNCSKCPITKCKIRMAPSFFDTLINNKIYPLRWLLI